MRQVTLVLGPLSILAGCVCGPGTHAVVGVCLPDEPTPTDDTGLPPADTATTTDTGLPPTHTGALAGTGDTAATSGCRLEGWSGGGSVVRVPEDVVDLPAALLQVGRGGAICLGPGTWTGDLRLGGRDLFVEGRSGRDLTFVQGTGTGPVLDVTGPTSRVSVVGVTLQGGVGPLGAGVHVREASPTLRDLRITGNTCGSASCTGVGIAVEAGASPTLTDVEISGNRTSGASEVFGVGLSVRDATATLDRVQLLDNVADVVVDAAVRGIGLAVLPGGTVTLQRGLIAGHHRIGPTGWWDVQEGAAAYVDRGSLTVGNTRVSDNRGPTTFSTVGELFGETGRLILENTVFADSEDHDDVAISVGQSSTVEVDHSVFRGGLAVFDLEGGAATARSSSFNGMRWVVVATQVRPVAFDHCHLGPGVAPGFAGVADADDRFGDPGFVDGDATDPALLDVHLLPGSLLVDGGPPAEADPDGTRADIGAYGGRLADDW